VDELRRLDRRVLQQAQDLLPVTRTIIEGPYFRLGAPERNSLIEPGWRFSISARVTNAPTPRAFLRLNAPILPRVMSATTRASGSVCTDATMTKSAWVTLPATTTTLTVSGA
jgi:hypothetical protein